MHHKIKLGVNVDHVATLRNARNIDYPDPVVIAQAAVDAGADFITVHLREDQRHIRYDDVVRLKSELKVPLNLEMALTEEMLKIALEIKPSFVCFVPENRQEITTEGGLDVIRLKNKISDFTTELHRTNIKVTLFVEPDCNVIDIANKLLVDTIEIHTGIYCHKQDPSELLKIINAAKFSSECNMECHAGHGINFDSAVQIVKIPHISALNIGHFLISNALLCGITESVKAMKKIIFLN